MITDLQTHTSFKITSYRDGDEHQIIDLFARCFPPKTMSAEYWNWRFKMNPAGPAVIHLAWLDDKLIGHYAVSPVMMRIDGKEVLTALSVTTMTNPAFRGMGIIDALAETNYNALHQMRIPLVWGFPNSQFRAARVARQKWRDWVEIPMLVYPIKTQEYFEDDRVISEKEFGPEYEALWQEVANLYHCSTIRNAPYLNWRFKLRPEKQYVILGYREGLNLLGYAVLDVFRGRELQVIDFVCVPDMKVMENLVFKIKNHASVTGLTVVKTWCNLNLPLRIQWEKLGFMPREPLTYLGGRILDGNLSAPEWLQTKWFFAMSDSDNY